MVYHLQLLSINFMPMSYVEHLYIQNQSWLKAWLTNRVSCPVLAMDIVQDTFERILRRPEVMREVNKPKSYLAKIAKGLVIDYWRRREIEQAYLEAISIHDQADEICEESRMEILETLVLVDRALNRLPSKVRHVFLRAQFDGAKYKDLAKELGVSERTVKNYMSQAMFACLSVVDDL